MTDEEMIESTAICIRHKVWGRFGWLSRKMGWHVHFLRPLSRFEYRDLEEWRAWAASHPWWLVTWAPQVTVPASDYTDEHYRIVEKDHP